MKLFRPIGTGEYYLIKESNYVAFPPRLEWQPIFYPVLNQAYAEQITNDWNTNDEFSGYCGLVTVFNLPEDYLKQFPVQNVGGKIYEELWVPAEELDNFNREIQGKIEVIDAFFGERFDQEKHAKLKCYYQKYYENRVS